MNVRIATCSTAILLALAAPAYAEVMTIEYSGTLGAGQDWPAGVVVSGSVTYDTDAVPTFTSSIFANYPIISGTAELNGAVFVSGTGHIQVRNNAPDTPTIYVDTISINMQAIGTFAGRTVRSIGATLHHAASSPPATLDSVALPDGDENLAAFTNRSVSVGYFDASNNISNVNGPLSNIAFVIEEPPILATSCDGFYTPFDEPLSLPRKSRRTIPQTLSLLDQSSNPLGPDSITPPLTAPVVNVQFVGAFTGGDPNELVESAGRATTGNAFLWDAETSVWTYNLGTAPFTQPGSYSVSVLAGDASYAISPPGCTQIFVRE